MEPNRISDPNTLVFERKPLGVILFSWESSPISPFLIPVVGIIEVSRTTLANEI